jgi:hypothetical protein
VTSATACHEASYPNRLQALLDERARDRGDDDRAHGWCTRRTHRLYAHRPPYDPDLIILGICLNDLQELENNLSRPPRVLAWLHQRSALRRIVDAPGRQIRACASSSRTGLPPGGKSYALFEEIRSCATT